MFLLTLSALALVAVLLFLTPVRWKPRVALLLLVLGAVLPVSRAIGVVMNPFSKGALWQGLNPVFGLESCSMDSLSALFVLIIALGGCATLVYACGYLKPYLAERSPAHLSLHLTALLTLVFSMMGVVTANGGYAFLFCWELMTIASFLLILFDGQRPEVTKAALSYLVMMHIGFLFLVGGFVKLWVETGSADFSALKLCYAEGGGMPLFLLFLIGFGMKAGMFPMHTWLPEAHPAAPSHVSAIMSGVMIKTGIYGILRTAAPLCGQALETAGILLLAAGVITGLWGVILAATQNDVKRLMAYSSIENIGVILLAIGLAMVGRSSGNEAVALAGICGALLHTLNHSFFKTMLFFGAGNIYSQTHHTTSFDRLGGLAKSMPMTALLFLVATAAICALPPLNGFVSEWLIYVGLLNNVATGKMVVASVAALVGLALIGGVVILAFTKLYGTVFLGSPRSHAVAEASEADNYRMAGMALPLVGILAVGLYPQGAVALVSRAARFFLPELDEPAERLAEQIFPESLSNICLTAWLLVAIVGLVWWLKSRTLKRRTVETGPTWGCGFTAPNIKMQYTGESFSEGLQSIATTMTQEKGESEAVAHQEIFPTSHHFALRHKDKIETLFSAWWMELMRRINSYVMRLRTGKINHYILMALAFLALVLILSIFNWI